MIAQAKGKYVRISPTKVRPVLDLIRGKKVNESRAALLHINKGATKVISKILNSAISSAKGKGIPEDQLFVSKISADRGPHWKRFRSAPFGRATQILKRTSHITIELDLLTKGE